MSEQNELKKPHIADAAATQGESPLKQRVHSAAKQEEHLRQGDMALTKKLLQMAPRRTGILCSIGGVDIPCHVARSKHTKTHGQHTDTTDPCTDTHRQHTHAVLQRNGCPSGTLVDVSLGKYHLSF